jgi:rhodanese-related sulfurtransferase
MLCRKRCYRNFREGDITIEELKNKILQGAIIIDVRSNQEYREGHINGAINIPEFEIENKILKEIPKKNQLIVLYCQYGGRSRNAIQIMKKMGYTNLYNLYGGLDML